MCVWIEDADVLSADSESLKIVFRNAIVDQYLSPKNERLGIAAIKGQGKTFLIKVKRQHMFQKGFTCLPLNMMVDSIDSAFHINRHLTKKLENYDEWVIIWKASICCAIIEYIKKTENDIVDMHDLQDVTIGLFDANNPNCQPSIYFTRILNMDYDDYSVVKKDSIKLIQMVGALNRSIAVFIDKVDQSFSRGGGLSSDNLSSVQEPIKYWEIAQISLAEAAYDIFNLGTHHVKVQFTIRQEALVKFSSFNEHKSRNTSSFITVLKYSKREMKEMYEVYIRSEDGKNLIDKDYKMNDPSRAFIGMSKITHGYAKRSEGIFDYIYRHTMQRPYDLMRICLALHNEVTKSSTEKDIRTIVNRESDKILKCYIAEFSDFFTIKTDELLKVADYINGNVLDNAFFDDAEKMFNDYFTQQSSCCFEKKRPFSILYNIGLIGEIKRNPGEALGVQKFVNVTDNILSLDQNNISPNSVFFIHPALSNYARKARKNQGKNHSICECIIVGDGYEITASDEEIKHYLKSAKRVLKYEKVFISSTIHDMHVERDAIELALNERFLYPVMSEKPRFDIDNAENVHSHDHCIDESLRCGCMIFVFSSKEGGPYSGINYTKYRDEIIAIGKSKGKEISPSISMMEYYVAKRKKVRCYAFIDAKLERKIKSGTAKRKVIDEYNFFSHYAANGKVIGNWISAYNDINDLTDRIRRLKIGPKTRRSL